jgi:hypothetical protein
LEVIDRGGELRRAKARQPQSTHGCVGGVLRDADDWRCRDDVDCVMMAVTWIWENLTGVGAAVGILTGLTGLTISIWTRLDQRGDARRNRIERNKIERAYLSGGGARAKRIIRVLPPNQTVLEDTGEFQFHVNNYGKTPGTLYQLGYGFCDEGSIPLHPEYTFQY